MEAAKVYFTDMRTNGGDSLLVKLDRLMQRAGIMQMPLRDKFVAIKIHFGEPGNLAFLRPNFARTVAERVRALGGIPFLTDGNTLYTGGRKNALEHLESAAQNGFSPQSTGCQILIADGLRGLDETNVYIGDMPGVKHVQEAKIGRAIMDADAVISLNHFKGHELTGFGGALKNLGMGGGSRAGKMEQHCNGKPIVDASLCRGCRRCGAQCAQSAITYAANKAQIDHDKCVGCGRCIGACNFDAIESDGDVSERDLCERIAEYALAVVKGRPSFHINIITQVTPCCDCHGESDLPIIPDVGMLASFDPVALDAASVDLCNRQPVIPGSMLDDELHAHGAGRDHFASIFPNTDWRAQLVHAEEIGLGTQRYELVTVK